MVEEDASRVMLRAVMFQAVDRVEGKTGNRASAKADSLRE